MAERLFLHVGPHKTGTTAFQTILDQNDARLRRGGFQVVRDIETIGGANLKFGRSTNGYRLAHCVIRAELLTPMRMLRTDTTASPDDAVAAVTAFNAWARSQPTPDLLLSSEAFSFLRASVERALMDAMTEGLDLVPVLVKRDRASWLRSWAGQLRKMRLTPPPGDPRGTVFDLTETSWLTDLDAICAFWGPAARVVDYEPAVERHGSIVPALGQAMGLPADLVGADLWENVGAGHPSSSPVSR